VSDAPESVFIPEGDGRYTPTEYARGPWDPRAQHGGAPATLIAGAFERMQPGAELPFARLSFSFLRPVPLAPLTLTTRIVRPGRRVQELEAELRAVGPADGKRGKEEEEGGVLVCRAHALRLVPAPEELPALALQVVETHEAPPLPGREEGHSVTFAPDGGEHTSFAASAMEMRFLHGRPLKGQLPEVGVTSSHVPVGTAGVWMRLCRPVLPGEEPTPLVYAMAAADFGNGIAAVLPFDEYVFINADLAIALNRRPEGEWIGLDARTMLHPGGIAWAQSIMHDERGPFGLATQALVVQRR
jgi:acyl-Coa thioesterase superfamily protein/acyl-CoA thioesterase superfamily protein